MDNRLLLSLGAFLRPGQLNVLCRPGQLIRLIPIGMMKIHRLDTAISTTHVIELDQN
jgi:hypothetical protein